MSKLELYRPSASESVSRGPRRQSLSERNLSAVIKNPHLSFMLDPGSKAPKMYNPRSRLPSAASIVRFNRSRAAAWRVDKSGDMRTESEHRFSASKKKSLRFLNLSRNHKIPDRYIGSMINSAVIQSELGGSSDRKAAKRRLGKLVSRFTSPARHSYSSSQYKRWRKAQTHIDALTSGVMDAKSYRHHFNSIKFLMSASHANLRLGLSPTNSGIGDSLDLNAVMRKRKAAKAAKAIRNIQWERPPSPISRELFDASKEFSGGSLSGSFPTISGSKRIATSSFTKFG